MTRRRRSFAALFAMIALLFAQLLVSAHACDMPRRAHPGEVAVHMEGCAGAMQDGGPCDNLCEQHCLYGHASVEGNPPVPMAMISPGPAFRVDLPEASPAAIPVLSRRLVSVVAAPSATILFGVLRI
jgi:hypothetical protein